MPFSGEYVGSSSRLLDEPVQFAESSVFDRRYRAEGAASGGCDAPTGLSKFPGLWKGFDDDGDADAERSDSIVMPVVLGDNGDAMIGAGIVRRFRYVGVILGSAYVNCFVGVVGRKSDNAAGSLARSWGRSMPPIINGLVLEPSPFELSDELTLSSPAASIARSSHLPRTASKLFATRCEGAHFLGLAVELVPVVFVRIPMPVCELLRDNELPLPLEVVRSKRRVWYAKGPEEDPNLEFREASDDFELEGSIFRTFHQSLCIQ